MRTYRRALGLSQSAFAARLNVPLETYRPWDAGRAEGRLAITPAREGRAPRALQLQIAARAIGVDDFPQQEGAAVAKLRREAAELVAGVGLGDRLGTLRYLVAGKRRHAVRRV